MPSNPHKSEPTTKATPNGLGSLSENALRVLEARYLKRDEAGKCTESPQDLFSRVAGCMADVETQYGANDAVRKNWEDRFYRLMVSREFMPNSPTLMNAGREMGMLSACFVLPVRDSIDQIFDAIKHTALIQKAGGGTGFAFDELRPTGDYIASSGGTTSGPISFWRAFSEATNAIQQGAFRRGANMGMMYIHHPDILKFLHAKQDLSQFTNYNISVKVTDEWMKAFLADAHSSHVVRNPRTGREYLLPKSLKIWEYDLRSLTPVEEKQDGVDYYTRQDIWNIIIDHAWQTGEPGVVFIDRIAEGNPTPHVGRIEATNPCGEQPLLPYEACNLGSINLACFVENPCTPEAAVNWEALKVCIEDSTRFLDNVIDANRYPLPQIHDICKANRKIGLGIMGFADALYMLNVGYDTEEGVAWGERFMAFLNDVSHDYSEQLARERGSFPNWKGSIWDTRHHRPMRNSTTTTVAPTGTISIIAGCSGGIEPLFGLVFFRHVLKGQEQGRKPMAEVNPIFETVAKQRGFYSEGLMDQIATDGTLAGLFQVPDDVKRVFVCANDVSPEWHVRMQAAFQKHCDASISKTINFPETASRSDVELIYHRSFELGCKGVTVYRDKCRSGQPMARKEKDPKAESCVSCGEPAAESPKGSVVESPEGIIPLPERVLTRKARRAPLEPQEIMEIASSVRVRQITPFGNMHVQITVDPESERELEVFAQLGKGGDLANSDLEAICRMVSLWLRAGGSLHHVIQQLKGIGSSLQVSTKEGKIMSLGDGLARALDKYHRVKSTIGLNNVLLGRLDGGMPAKGFSQTGDALPGGSLDDASGPVASDRSGVDLHAERRLRANGNGNGGNGNGNGGNGNGHGHSGSRLEGANLATAIDLLTESNIALATDTEDAPIDGRQLATDGYRIVCPECNSALQIAEGCKKCLSCGWAQC